MTRKGDNAFANLRKVCVKYAFNSRALTMMSEPTFFDFTAFLSQQTDVDDVEEIRQTLNARELLKSQHPKTPQEKIKLQISFIFYILFMGLFGFIIVCIAYSIWYWQKDAVKSVIGFNLLILIFGSLLLFCTFLYLYNVIVLQYKKIMLLM